MINNNLINTFTNIADNSDNQEVVIVLDPAEVRSFMNLYVSLVNLLNAARDPLLYQWSGKAYYRLCLLGDLPEAVQTLHNAYSKAHLTYISTFHNKQNIPTK